MTAVLRSRTRLIVAGGVAAALLVTAAVIWWPHQQDPEKVVRDYLEAVRAKDVERALRIAYASPEPIPAGAHDSDTLLDADVLRRDWTIGSIRASSYGDDWRVRATLRTTSGVVVAGDFLVRGQRSDLGRLYIDNPLIELRISAPDGLTQLNVNGLRIGDDLYDEPRTFLAFPGAYQVSAGTAALFGNTTQRITRLAGKVPLNLTPVVTKDGHAALDKLLSRHLDECEKTLAYWGVFDCPIEPFTPAGTNGLENSFTYRWTVLSKPHGDTRYQDDGTLIIDTTKHPGRVRATATADNGVRGIRTITLKPMRAEVFINEKGEFWFEHLEVIE